MTLALTDFGEAQWISFDHAMLFNQDAASYVCFRHEFQSEPVNEALLHITADYRYTVWLNGHFIGQGPVRGWTQEWFYDTYEVEAWLQPGINVIAVLVHVLNTSTFQYIAGSPGLLARLSGHSLSGKMLDVVSSHDWKWRRHCSFGSPTPRISSQQAYAEHYDAGLELVGWKQAGFVDNEEWREALLLGAAGCEPWIKLIPRDIPLLTEDEMYPASIKSCEMVALPEPAWSMDLRQWLLPGVVNASPNTVCGMVATTVKPDSPLHVRFCFQDRTSGMNVKLYVDGQAATSRDVSGSHWSGLYDYEVYMDKGEHLLSFLIDGTAHDYHFQVSFQEVESGRSIGLEPRLTGISGGRFVFFGAPLLEDSMEPQSLASVGSWKSLSALEGMRVIPHGQEHVSNVFQQFTDAVVLSGSLARDQIQGLYSSCGGNGDYTLLRDPGAGKAVRIIYEFERMTAGWIEFEICAEEGAIIDGYGFEAYRGGNIVHMHSMHNTLRYVARKGWQRYRSFIQRGFRYWGIQASDLNGDLKIRFVRCIQRTYPSPKIGGFRCGDERLNQIFEMSRRTAQLCSDDAFVDCPTYEQAFWVGDAYVMSGVQSTLAGAAPLVRRSLRLAASSMNRSPIVESQVPSGWVNVLSTWSLLWSIACEEYYGYWGDAAFAEEMYPWLVKQIHYFRDECVDEGTGLIRSPFWNLLDWADMDCPDGAIVTHVNAWLAESCRRTAQLADNFGCKQDAMELRAFRASIIDGMNAHLWSGQRQAYADCIHEDGRLSSVFSEQTNLLCYLHDVALPERQSALLSRLVEPPADFVRCATPFMRYFKLQALEKAGMLPPLVQEIQETWGYMLEQGSTTCWEDMPGRWSSDYPTRSYCHGWSVAPAHFLPRIILGIAPMEAGFKKVRIAPQPIGLHWAEGKLNTPEGIVGVSWTSRESEFKVDVRLPRGVLGEVILPLEPSEADRIIVSGSGSGVATPYVAAGKWTISVQDEASITIVAQ
ncbi:alpha-L-rhamnosidase N-terminal domain-containing protein [Paenibacillus sp. J5C_2022]|uniref:alpha-L-rhamnosidase-related protein n=1 Tax=Paenibacillus sp. J5C2022 TaxID=2977129 RepID=UPI0021CE7464|nr:alpha-L-rhamnosidase C-terminal domain-containing protein [Paenibacillus sp. J5C2022]MCU6709664.1 alpha-L-rhamnosidase N-terminal domain-containing protein [Paenibacillus sp. J5C2022]